MGRKAKLQDDVIQGIRKMWKNGTYTKKEICATYNISYNLCCKVINGDAPYQIKEEETVELFLNKDEQTTIQSGLV